MSEVFHLKLEISSTGKNIVVNTDDSNTTSTNYTSTGPVTAEETSNEYKNDKPRKDSDSFFKEQELNFGQRKHRDISIESFTNYRDRNNLQSMLDWRYEGETAEGGGTEEGGVANTRRVDDLEDALGGSLSDGGTYNRVMSRKNKRKQTRSISEVDRCKSYSSVVSGVRRPSANENQTLSFFSGNPHVQTTHGTIHLYKQSHGQDEDISHGDMICILAIPSKITTSDLMQFIASVETWVQHLKIIRDDIPNQYMVLIKFRTMEYATEFYTMFDRQPFNSFEPETCHCVYVSSVQITKEEEGGSLAVTGLTELPICAVCLEKLDESVSGILTVLCNHSFHGSCLTKWADTSCPVCRYIQTPPDSQLNQCSTCRAHSDSLWICLICGNVGCGRYVEGCANRHYTNTNHAYSMELSNQRVWDYTGDNYVHRLIQSKTDGKLVPLENQKEDDIEKYESITLEYTHLLTSQLETQRLYFEDKLRQLEIGMRRCGVDVIDISEYKEKEMECSNQILQNTKLKQKYLDLLQKYQCINCELDDEKEFNKSLVNNQQICKSKINDLEKIIKTKDTDLLDMKEQNRDLMFFMDSNRKLEEQSAELKQEIQEGTIIIGEPKPSTSKKSKKKKNR